MEMDEGMDESEELFTNVSMERERLRLTLVGLCKRRGEIRGGDGLLCGDSRGEETVIP